ncbi:sensor histidine kinase [Streptomyces sp. NPDC092296]|uniref:sensor histidine kinase n=1 Tax=Streptomyces sp. NPDC092296 TaxID=3366012 RepID=UPI0038165A3F
MSVGGAVSGAGARAEAERVRVWLLERLTAQRRCLVLGVRAWLGPAVLLVVGMVVLGLIGASLVRSALILPLLAVGVGIFAVLAFRFGRWNAAWSRRQAESWFGIRLPVRYRPIRSLEQNDRGHWWTGHGYHRRRSTAEVARYVNWAVRDPETWRDQLWLLLNPSAAAITALPAVGLFIGGTTSAAVVFLRLFLRLTAGYPSEVPGHAQALALSLLAALVGLALAPYALRVHTGWLRQLLDPDGGATRARLAQRVQHLTATRADAVGEQAAELRRIERDLHDGAQARLVAIGMTLGTIEHLMDTDAPAARVLLAEARQASHKALQELRDLVRGIHPPVLAERGLGDAVRALALDSPLPVEVFVDLPDRPPAPVEAAAYFSVCELLTNAAKHSGADQVWVDILHRAGSLRITVTDDGRGGADPARGSGLRGIERRLGTFDGVLALSSAPGGPTTVTMELPCASSSPRTCTSFEKG